MKYSILICLFGLLLFSCSRSKDDKIIPDSLPFTLKFSEKYYPYIDKPVDMTSSQVKFHIEEIDSGIDRIGWIMNKEAEQNEIVRSIYISGTGNLTPENQLTYWLQPGKPKEYSGLKKVEFIAFDYKTEMKLNSLYMKEVYDDSIVIRNTQYSPKEDTSRVFSFSLLINSKNRDCELYKLWFTNDQCDWAVFLNKGKSADRKMDTIIIFNVKKNMIQSQIPFAPETSPTDIILKDSLMIIKTYDFNKGYLSSFDLDNGSKITLSNGKQYIIAFLTNGKIKWIDSLVINQEPLDGRMIVSKDNIYVFYRQRSITDSTILVRYQKSTGEKLHVSKLPYQIRSFILYKNNLGNEEIILTSDDGEILKANSNFDIIKKNKFSGIKIDLLQSNINSNYSGTNLFYLGNDNEFAFPALMNTKELQFVIFSSNLDIILSTSIKKNNFKTGIIRKKGEAISLVLSEGNTFSLFSIQNNSLLARIWIWSDIISVLFIVILGLSIVFYITIKRKFDTTVNKKAKELTNSQISKLTHGIKSQVGISNDRIKKIKEQLGMLIFNNNLADLFSKAESANKKAIYRIDAIFYYLENIKLIFEENNLYDIIMEFIDENIIDAKLENISLINNIPKDIKPIPLCKQYFLALLDTSYDNSIASLISSDNKMKMIEYNVEQSNVKTILTIKDNGLGTEQDVLEKINKGINVTTKNSTGLGFSIIKDVCDSHNAKIEILSKKNDGFKIIITFQHN